MTIFNSLGSNYTFDFALKTLFALDKPTYPSRLQSYLAERYSGEVILTYKGREAIQLALQAIGEKGKMVGICGYTCFAVYDAVVKEGYTPKLLDIDPETLHFSLATVKKVSKENPQMKVLIIQNTLGYPVDAEAIVNFCKEKGIVLIEDLAHAIGATYPSGKEVGTVGDFTVLSFSQDKVVDGISGGALIIRNNKYEAITEKAYLVNVPDKRQQIDRWYPFFTFLIRKTYRSGIGKLMHVLLKRFRLLSNPMQSENELYTLPAWYCGIIYTEFVRLSKSLAHRRKISTVYTKYLDKRFRFPVLTALIPQSVNLRFPILVEDRNRVIALLKSEGVFVSDIWYDAPIAPIKYLGQTNYKKGDCPNAEMISEQMLNLPTHTNVSENHAKQIALLVNKLYE